MDNITPSICGIGASAGGLEALQKFFETIPNSLGLAYAVVVHLAPDRKSDLSTIIGRWTKMPVTQVGDNNKAALEANHVYVIAPDRMLEITHSHISAAPFVHTHGQRAAIDLFFRSLAAHSNGNGFAVILSGSGSDGALGARSVKESGGVVLVQDPNEALYNDMPRSVITMGAADVVLPVKELAGRLEDLVHHTQQVELSSSQNNQEEQSLKNLLDLLHTRTGHDFSRYKRSTVLRRLGRRLQICHQPTISDYLAYVRTHLTEIQGLFNDLLISVTSFFRDPEAWEALRELVVKPLVNNFKDQIRVWVPGCATGEEAYSLSILFQEELERTGIQGDLIVFATDVDESSLQEGRTALYPKMISADVSEARLDRYFRIEGDRYRLGPKIRDSVVFASHNFLQDPPYSRQHLISCRNVLIYLNHELQERAMEVFRYACQGHGFLFMGQSETASESLFHLLDKKHRIFITQPQAKRPLLPDLMAAPGIVPIKPPLALITTTTRSAAESHKNALEEIAPPNVLVSESGEVVHISASAARFFQQGAGPISHRLPELVRPELREELRTALNHVPNDPTPYLSAFVPVSFGEGNLRRVAILAQQRVPKNNRGVQALVTFLDAGEEIEVDYSSSNTPLQQNSSAEMQALREKLGQSEQRLASIRNDHANTIEELQGANEELQSLNEEYRSTTEELETSKEELQSINEELHTVNNQLRSKLDEVVRVNDDLENLMAATNVATLFLDRAAHIRRFTPQLTEIFNIKQRDLGRPIYDVVNKLVNYNSIEQDTQSVITNLAPLERELKSTQGQVYLARWTPYQGEGEVGVVIVFINVTHLKVVEEELRQSEQNLQAELKVLQRVHSMTMAIATAPNMPTAFDGLIRDAIELLDADLGNIAVFDAKTNQFAIVMQRGFTPSVIKRIEQSSSQGKLGYEQVLQMQKTVCIADIMNDSGYLSYPQLIHDGGYRAVQLQPLINKTSGQLIGVLSINFRKPHIFTKKDHQLGDLLAQQVTDLLISRAQQKDIASLELKLSE